MHGKNKERKWSSPKSKQEWFPYTSLTQAENSHNRQILKLKQQQNLQQTNKKKQKICII